MTKRSLVLAAALSAVALAPMPVLARDNGPAEIADQLRDPKKQQGMADALAAMTQAMMSIKLAPFADAMEKMGDSKAARKLARAETLGDLAGKDARRMPQEVSRQVPQMMGMMAGMAGAMEAMLPQLEAMAKQMGTAMDGAIPGSVGQSASVPGELAAGEATEE
jgi:hypothetical protein